MNFDPSTGIAALQKIAIVDTQKGRDAAEFLEYIRALDSAEIQSKKLFCGWVKDDNSALFSCCRKPQCNCPSGTSASPAVF